MGATGTHRVACGYVEVGNTRGDAARDSPYGTEFRGKAFHRPHTASALYGRHLRGDALSSCSQLDLHRSAAALGHRRLLCGTCRRSLRARLRVLAVDHFVPASEFKKLMGACLLFVLILMMVTEFRGKQNMLIDKWWYGPLFGLLGGFTTMIGNAAGPVMAIYLLSTKMPKMNFVGTNAWFFMVVNLLKVPLQIFAWHNITLHTFAADLCCLPFIALGGLLGLRLVRWLPEKIFRRFITIVTWISVILMLI